MVKTYKMQTIDVVNGELEGVVVDLVKMEDYLKVVEEKEILKDKLSCLKFNSKNKLKIKDNVLQEVKKQRDGLDKELEDKNEKIERLEEKIEELVGLNQKLLSRLAVEEKEETYTLSYSYLATDGVTTKIYRQSGLLKEEFELMYGMDSDNWLSHSLVKDREVK